jgi:hypothetical protein
MSVYPIADYITIFPTDDDVLNAGSGISIFNIPSSTYLSNAKGQYCLVSLADASVDIEDQELPIMISLSNVLNNSSEQAVIGSFSITAEQGNTRFHHSFNKNDVKYLIPARPSQLRINGMLEDQTPLDINTGYLTFKFEYLSKEAVKAMNEQTDYNTF